MKQGEHEIQKTFFKWCKLHESQHPALRTIFAIPNGGHRDIRTAMRLKAEGVKAGIWDVFLPYPTFVTGTHAESGEKFKALKHAGLWIEFKYGKNRLTPEQHTFAMNVAPNYQLSIAYSWQDGVDAVKNYLGIMENSIWLIYICALMTIAMKSICAKDIQLKLVNTNTFYPHLNGIKIVAIFSNGMETKNDK